MISASAKRIGYLSVCALVMASALAGAQARTSHATAVTFATSVQLPGVVLDAGDYVFSRLVSSGGLTRVEIATASPRRVIARLPVVPVSRPAGGETVTFLRTRVGVPAALAGWFTDGGRDGMQFVYTPEQRRALGDLQPVGALASTPR